jgi:hypothetical protein
MFPTLVAASAAVPSEELDTNDLSVLRRCPSSELASLVGIIRNQTGTLPDSNRNNNSPTSVTSTPKASTMEEDDGDDGDDEDEAGVQLLDVKVSNIIMFMFMSSLSLLL